MNRLIFTRTDVTIFEDRDFPEDPAPYASIEARDFPVILELEEAEDLARALTEWIRETRERDARKLRDARRRARELLELAAEHAPALLPDHPAPTLLEIIQRARRVVSRRDP